MFSTSSFKLIFTKQLPLMAWRPHIKLLITVSLNKSHLSVMYILNFEAREQHIRFPKGSTWKLINNSLCNITISQAHIKCKKWMKARAKAPPTQLLYVPLHAAGFIKWSMWREIKVSVLGGFPHASILPGHDHRCLWMPYDCMAEGIFLIRPRIPVSFSTHGSSLSVSVFYLTTMPVKCMYGTYSQRRMPLIRLKNWFMAILLSPLASCGKVFWGGNHLLWFITPRGLKLLVRTASVWNSWHLLLGSAALLGSAVQTLSLVWITSQAWTGWLMWKANKC